MMLHTSLRISSNRAANGYPVITPFARNAAISIDPTENSPALAFWLAPIESPALQWPAGSLDRRYRGGIMPNYMLASGEIAHQLGEHSS
jgi:hypothetical protein